MLRQKLISQNSLASPIVTFLGVTPHISWESVSKCCLKGWQRLRPDPHFLYPTIGAGSSLFTASVIVLNSPLVFKQFSASSSYFFGLYSIDRVVDLFLYLFRCSPIANLVHPLPHGFLNAPQCFIFLDECLEVFVLPDVSRLFITLSDGASYIIAPLSLKALSNVAVHFLS